MQVRLLFMYGPGSKYDRRSVNSFSLSEPPQFSVLCEPCCLSLSKTTACRSARFWLVFGGGPASGVFRQSVLGESGPYLAKCHCSDFSQYTVYTMDNLLAFSPIRFRVRSD
jgi:hypothetical protein